MGSSISLFFKVLFGVLAVVGFSLFLLFGVLESGGKNFTTTLPISHESSENLKQVIHSEFDLNYMSKRRVPNGPDPIHNRKAGKSKLPPGQA